jgi:hypothetical protein
MNDHIKIYLNLSTKEFRVNDKVCEYKFDAYSDIPIRYFYGEYDYYREDGEVTLRYYGLPEGSKLYYAKAWGNDGLQTYIGYKSSAKNPDTGVTENCWRWHTSTESGYDFAYYSSKLTNRQPYGAWLKKVKNQ